MQMIIHLDTKEILYTSYQDSNAHDFKIFKESNIEIDERINILHLRNRSKKIDIFLMRIRHKGTWDLEIKKKHHNSKIPIKKSRKKL